jgi:hypothetical protein
MIQIFFAQELTEFSQINDKSVFQEDGTILHRSSIQLMPWTSTS